MTVSRLLKSCAKPAESRLALSILCGYVSCSAAAPPESGGNSIAIHSFWRAGGIGATRNISQLPPASTALTGIPHRRITDTVKRYGRLYSEYGDGNAAKPVGISRRS